MLRNGGFLVTSSCTNLVSPELFLETIQMAAWDAKKRIRQVRLPPHGGEHALIFFGREAVGGDNLGGDLAHGARIACGGSFVMSQREALLHFPLRPGGQWLRIAA